MSKLITFCTLVCFITSVYGQSAEDNGNAAYKSRAFYKAISYYKEALKEVSTSSELLTRIGHCYRYTNQTEMAILSYKHAVKQQDVDPIVHFWLGTSYKSVGKYEEAKASFTTFEQFNPAISNLAVQSCEFATADQPTFYKVEEVEINSPKYDDYAPVFHKDGVVFTSSRKIMHANLPGGFSDPSIQNFLFRTDLNAENGLEKLRIVKGGNMFLPTNNVAPFAIHPEQEMAISTYNTFSNGVRHVRGATLSALSMEEHKLNDLSDFTPGLKLPWITEGVSASFPCYINDGRSILFAAEGLSGGLGGYDLYRADKKEDGSWTEPIHLGDQVNSPGDEICPFVDEDGNLYFSSDLLPGFGGFDVFISRKLNGTWSDVKNLGPGLNTGSDELYFVYDTDRSLGLYASDRNGNMDIFRAVPTSLIFEVQDSLVKINEKLDQLADKVALNNGTVDNQTNHDITEVAESDLKETEKVASVKAKSEVEAKLSIAATTTPDKVESTDDSPCSLDLFVGAIRDAETSEFIEGAYVYLKNLSTNEELRLKQPTNKYGEYSTVLSEGQQYQIIVSKQGYTPLQFEIDTKEGGQRTILGTRSLESSKVAVENNSIDIEREMSVVHHQPNTKELIERPTESRFFSTQSTDENLDADVFVIQAIAVQELSDDQQFELKRFGNLIIEQKDNVQVYKIGYFTDRTHVENSLSAVQAIYPDAFIRSASLPMETVGDRIASSSKMIYPPNQLIPANMAARGGSRFVPMASIDMPEQTKQEEIQESPEAKAIAKVEYRLQIGVLSAENDAPFAHLKEIAEVTKEKLHGKVYYFLGGSESLDAISIIREKAIKNGMTSSFVVPFINGVKSTMKDI